MKAYVFPGQGSQFEGMGKDLHESSDKAKELFAKANEILGFDITKIMFEGTKEDLTQTKVTQPAVFLHSVIKAEVTGIAPDMVAGHSLGEFSALVAAKVLSFENALTLVSKRAMAMQAACEIEPSTMAAITRLEDQIVIDACSEIDDVVVPANFNCPGQLVISGSISGIEKACASLLEKGAKRALVLKVGGAFHSPFMEPAREELANAINEMDFSPAQCPIYQNVDAQPSTDPAVIKEKLIKQLTAPVLWTQTVQNMSADGVTEFIECGPGKVLQGLVKKINSEAEVSMV